MMRIATTIALLIACAGSGALAVAQEATPAMDIDGPKTGCVGVTDQPMTMPGAISFTYKSTDKRPLRIHVFAPSGEGKHPAILFFFGGGFRIGKVEVFADQAKAFAARGYVAALADYRVSCRDQTTPTASVEDGGAAYHWLRTHNRELNVDSKRVVLSGGSSGGFVAAAAAMLAPANERPTALVLFNPATDLRPALARFKLTMDQASAISPAALPAMNLPPTVIFHGVADRTVPIAMVRDFCRRAVAAGRTCQLNEYAGQDHSFFHSKEIDPAIQNSPYADTLAKALAFLKALPEMKRGR